jgi:hypothetical protein
MLSVVLSQQYCVNKWLTQMLDDNRLLYNTYFCVLSYKWQEKWKKVGREENEEKKRWIKKKVHSFTSNLSDTRQVHSLFQNDSST